MPSSRLALPLWLIALDTTAMVMPAAGGLRLLMPELEFLHMLDGPTACGLVALGLAALAVFRVFLLRLLRERRAGKQ
jgi:hypothetical protein